MRHLKLEKPKLQLVEFSFAFDTQGDGVRPLWETPKGALAGSVDELRCENSSWEVTPDDAEVRKMGALDGDRTRGLRGAYPRRPPIAGAFVGLTVKP